MNLIRGENRPHCLPCRWQLSRGLLTRYPWWVWNVIPHWKFPGGWFNMSPFWCKPYKIHWWFGLLVVNVVNSRTTHLSLTASFVMVSKTCSVSVSFPNHWLHSWLFPPDPSLASCLVLSSDVVSIFGISPEPNKLNASLGRIDVTKLISILPRRDDWPTLKNAIYVIIIRQSSPSDVYTSPPGEGNWSTFPRAPTLRGAPSAYR